MSARYREAKVSVPLRWFTGLDDPVIVPSLHRWYGAFENCEFEEVAGVGHWRAEQAPN